MKLILALIFCASLAAGQDKISWELSYHFNAVDDSTSGKILVIIGKDSVRTPSPFAAVTVHTLLRLYTRYEADCFADSTLTEGAVFRDVDYGDEYWGSGKPRAGVWIANLVRLESRYTHREPTFTGFIQFLRRKQ